MLKITTIVGARPQFIKASALSRAIAGRRDSVEETLVHTGQHYDENLNNVFFRELDLPVPQFNLGVGSSSHGRQTALMLERLEPLLIESPPDAVIVYGDTNSTLAGSLAAAKLNIPVAHIEAGLRSHNRQMAEEINRVLTDHIAAFCFCPTENAVKNLSVEGIIHAPDRGVHVMNVGDVMLDSLLHYRPVIDGRLDVLSKLPLKPGDYALATIHRAETTDNPRALSQVMRALQELAAWKTVILPVHPRTRKALNALSLELSGDDFKIIDPVGYLDMLALISHAALVVTDSGGVQKEAFFLETPCVTARVETEWTETVESGWNVLAGERMDLIPVLARQVVDAPKHSERAFFGDGDAAGKIVTALVDCLS